MYSLFTDSQRHYGGGIEARRFYDVEKRIVEDINRIVDYYRRNNFTVKTHHLLCRLIQTMGVPLHYPLDRYYEAAVARHLFIANTYRMTSAIQAGDLHKGVFYHGSPEIHLAYHEEVRPSEAVKNWREIQAVKILTSPISNLSYMLPTGLEHNSERGLAVIGFDIPKLMLQFRCFWEEQIAKQAAGESVLTVAHFVMKYVLPNMLYSQTDQAILNRLINFETGAPMGSSLKKHPFHIVDIAPLLDKGLEELNQRFSTLRMDYRVFLNQIPSVFSEKPWSMPDIAETRQVWWALFTARFKLIEYLWNVGGENLRHSNQSHLNALKIDLRRFESEGSLRNNLPWELYRDIASFARHVT